jgi:type IV pilus assembly protein PilM
MVGAQPGRGSKNGFFGLFGGGSRAAPVGLAIGTSSVKIVELENRGSKKTPKWKLVRFGMAQLPQDVIANREIINPMAVSQAIQAVAQQIGLKKKNLCTALCGPAVIIKRLQVEAPNPKETQDAVFWEAEQYLPFDPSEVVMDYHLLSRGKDGRADVLLIAAKTSSLDNYMTCVLEGGLDPKVVDSEFFSLQDVLEFNSNIPPTEAALAVDIGASSTKMVVVHQGVPVFTKDVALGGANVTSEIQHQLNISPTDAESMKVNSQAGNLPQEVAEILGAMNENFANELRKTQDFYHASGTGASITSIWLGGGGSKLPGLSRTVEEICGVPTQFLNPFHQISYDPSKFSPELIQSVAPFLCTATGLAMRGGLSE